MDLVRFAIWKSQKVESLPGVKAVDVAVSKFVGAKGHGQVVYDPEKEIAAIECRGEVERCPFSGLPNRLKELCSPWRP